MRDIVVAWVGTPWSESECFGPKRLTLLVFAMPITCCHLKALSSSTGRLWLKGLARGRQRLSTSNPKTCHES